MVRAIEELTKPKIPARGLKLALSFLISSDCDLTKPKIPARGLKRSKLFKALIVSDAARKAKNPRKGTETSPHSPSSKSTPLPCKTKNPRKGTETFTCVFGYMNDGIKLAKPKIPARGLKRV